MRLILPRSRLLTATVLMVWLTGCSCFGTEDPHSTPGTPSATESGHASTAFASAADVLRYGYSVNADIYRTGSVEFVPHTGSKKYASYLAMNIPFEPVESLRQNLESSLGVSLKHRGEAHITVVTPPEFERLSPYLSIRQINMIAAARIQKLAFNIECVGESQALLKNEIARTFFLVVSSEDLIALRETIALAYETSGGAAPAFLEEYFPHVTIGYTHKDLHSSDGAVKNSLSCIEPVAIR